MDDQVGLSFDKYFQVCWLGNKPERSNFLRFSDSHSLMPGEIWMDERGELFRDCC